MHDDDMRDMVENDLQKFRRYSGSGGLDSSLPAMLELGLGSLTALVALVWLVSLWWVPGVIDGQTWLGGGLLGLVIFGGPAAAVYWLRRGGARVVRQVVREAVR